MLYVDNGREIDGATKFQKLVFLAQQETDIGKPFEYRADKYGPFSPELHATLDELEERNLIKKEVRTNRSGNEKHTYRLTDYGRRVLMEVKKKDDSEKFEGLLEDAHSIKRKYNSKTLDRILNYVYSKYEEYTSESELEEYKR